MAYFDSVATAAAFVVLAMAVTVLVWLATRMLAAPLFNSGKASATNYAGRTVHYGLGVVWFIWALTSIVGSLVSAFAFGLDVSATFPAAILAAVVFTLGLFDDAYGTGESRGFRGHLRAIARGQLTTGGLKLCGVSAAALAFVAATMQAVPYPWMRPVYEAMLRSGGDSLGSVATTVAIALLAGASIALTANLLNLTDLRPGRALKTYAALVALGVALALGTFAWAKFTTGACPTSVALLSLLGTVTWLAGPAIVSWRYDLSERAMLGDAGANVMGVLAGVFIVSQLNLIGLTLYATAVFALNLASEKVSFSRVIASNRALSYLDNLGRLKDASDTSEE